MARTFSHWTPQYLFDRAKEKLYRRRHPGLPWFTPQAIDFLQKFLLSTAVDLEFGSGRSTLWFARRTRHLTSVEHNANWATEVRARLQVTSLENVDLILAPKPEDANPDIDQTEYVSVTGRFAPASLDFVIVDGIYRAHCALRSIPLLKPQGMLIIDNVNKALPSNSISPNSRSVAEGPDGEVWAQVWQQIEPWRRYWTSNGVADTAIFFKP